MLSFAQIRVIDEINMDTLKVIQKSVNLDDWMPEPDGLTDYNLLCIRFIDENIALGMIKVMRQKFELLATLRVKTLRV